MQALKQNATGWRGELGGVRCARHATSKYVCWFLCTETRIGTRQAGMFLYDVPTTVCPEASAPFPPVISLVLGRRAEVPTTQEVLVVEDHQPIADAHRTAEKALGGMQKGQA